MRNPRNPLKALKPSMLQQGPGLGPGHTSTPGVRPRSAR